MDEVELLETNPSFAKIRFPSGRESTVSISDLAPCLQHQVPQPISPVNRALSLREQASLPSNSTGEGDKENNFKNDTGPSNVDQHSTSEYSSSPRCSYRQRRPPQRYGQNIYDKYAEYLIVFTISSLKFGKCLKNGARNYCCDFVFFAGKNVVSWS